MAEHVRFSQAAKPCYEKCRSSGTKRGKALRRTGLYGLKGSVLMPQAFPTSHLVFGPVLILPRHT